MKAETKRLIAAVFVAPFSLAFVWGGLTLVIGDVEAALFFFLYVFIMSGLVTIIIGLPVHFALKKSKQFRLLDYLIAAFVVGLMPIIALILGEYGNAMLTWPLVLYFSAIVIPSTLFTAGMAWAIARPDKTDEAQFYLAD